MNYERDYAQQNMIAESERSLIERMVRQNNELIREALRSRGIPEDAEYIKTNCLRTIIKDSDYLVRDRFDHRGVSIFEIKTEITFDRLGVPASLNSRVVNLDLDLE